MEEKFMILNDQLAKLQGTTLMLETELVKKNKIIDNQYNELNLVKAENEQLQIKHHIQTANLRKNK